MEVYLAAQMKARIDQRGIGKKAAIVHIWYRFCLAFVDILGYNTHIETIDGSSAKILLRPVKEKI
jgi:hypothetical protein